MNILKSLLPSRPPRLVAISLARDEEDIVEAFVRHTATFVDHHIIADHCSQDQTPRILATLQKEGLPLTLYQSRNPVYLQPPLTNHLLQIALEKCEADWILPLDCDEFIGETDPDLDIHNFLRPLAANHPCVRCPVKNYFPTPDDNPEDPNPTTRIRCRTLKPCPPLHKVLIHRSLAAQPDTRISPGSHDFRRKDRPVPDFEQNQVFLAHFPNRSPAQLAGKVALAELGKDAFGSKRKGLGIHRTQAFHQLKEDPAAFLDHALDCPHELTEDPFSYQGTALMHTPPSTHLDEARLIRMILTFAHDLVRRHAALSLKSSESKNPIYDSNDLILEELTDTSKDR